MPFRSLVRQDEVAEDEQDAQHHQEEEQQWYVSTREIDRARRMSTLPTSLPVRLALSTRLFTDLGHRALPPAGLDVSVSSNDNSPEAVAYRSLVRPLLFHSIRLSTLALEMPHGISNKTTLS